MQKIVKDQFYSKWGFSKRKAQRHYGRNTALHGFFAKYGYRRGHELYKALIAGAAPQEAKRLQRSFQSVHVSYLLVFLQTCKRYDITVKMNKRWAKYLDL